MKRTPMSMARAVGSRKLTFAMIDRNRSTVTETLHNRYVTQCHGMSHITGNAYAMRTHTERIPSAAAHKGNNHEGKGIT